MKRFTIKHLALSIAFALACISMQAQTRVTGNVTDESSNPIVGATVLVKGTLVGTTTDVRGGYAITVPEGRNELEISFIGYQTQTVRVGRNTTINITLKDSEEMIDEVIVVGFGQMRTVDVTGAVTSVKIDETQASQVTSLDQILQGRAAGVQVTASNAAPGAEVNITIRGNNSFTGTGEPLYVVDGVIMNPAASDGSVITQGGTANSEAGQETNALMGIAPQDIEDMQILKDASATAIYGAMGANGVVLITTKMGTSERPRVQWSSRISVSQRAKKMDILDLDGYADFMELRMEAGLADYSSTLRQIFIDPSNRSLGLQPNIVPMDWQDYATRTGISHQHRLSISGKTKTSSYLISGYYNKTEGIITGTGAQSMTFRVNFDHNLNDYIKIGTRTNFSRVLLDMTQSTDSRQLSTASSMIRSMLTSKPYYRTTSTGDDPDDDDLDENGDLQSTPAAWLVDTNDRTTEHKITPSLYVEAKVLKWLTYKFSISGDYRIRERTKWKGPLIYSSTNNRNAGVALNTSLSYTAENTLSYTLKFDKHRISGNVGTTFYRAITRTTNFQGWNIDQYIPQHNSINYAPNTSGSYSEQIRSLLSYFVRGIYSYDDRYVATVTFRADGSSKFLAGDKFSYFPSIGLTWRINQEEWFPLDRKVVNNLKIRGGWGRVGSERSLTPYQGVANYGKNSFADHTPGNALEGTIGVYPSNLPNPELVWETTESINIGLDIGLYRDRYNMTFDIYQKRTKDLLQRISVPYSTGHADMWANSGVVQNRGLEITADATPIRKNGFIWNLAGNISFNRNIIVDIGREYSPENVVGAPFFYGSVIGSSNLSNPGNIFIEGFPMGLFYGYQTQGIVQLNEVPGPGMAENEVIGPGGVRYVIVHRKKETAEEQAVEDARYHMVLDDRVIIGDPNPNFTYGFTTSFSYKGLRLSATFNGVYGNDILNANLQSLTNVSSLGNRLRYAIYDAWTPTNPSQMNRSITGLTAGEMYYVNDRFIEDGSFLRFANLTLAYSVPTKKIPFFRTLSVNVSVTNLHVWTKYSGWDPEVSSYGANVNKMGIDNGSYPGARTYSLGVNASF